MQISELQKLAIDFNKERDRMQFHNPKDVATTISIEASELQEKFLWKTQEESYEIGKNDPEVAGELADVFINILLFAEACGIDLGQALIDKMKENGIKYPVEKFKGSPEKHTRV